MKESTKAFWQKVATLVGLAGALCWVMSALMYEGSPNASYENRPQIYTNPEAENYFGFIAWGWYLVLAGALLHILIAAIDNARKQYRTHQRWRESQRRH